MALKASAVPAWRRDPFGPDVLLGPREATLVPLAGGHALLSFRLDVP
jgi:hypothetical protein